MPEKEEYKEKYVKAKNAFQLKDVIAVTVIFIIGFFVSTLPVQKNTMPFGEGDAGHQYALADTIYGNDKIFFTRLPPHLFWTWYSNPNSYHPGSYDSPNYPPFYFTAGALIQAFSGERLQGLNIFIALGSLVFGSLAMYFFMRKLFGFYPAVIVGFAMLFAYRSIMGYVWGQRAILASYAFVPVALYCYYQFANSFIEKKPKNYYVIVLALLLSAMALFHAVTFVLACLAIIVYTIFLFVKHKKIPFDIKWAGIALLIFMIIFAPFAYQMKDNRQSKPKPFGIYNIGSVFNWYDSEGHDNPQLYQYTAAYGGWWSLPLLLLGVLLLFLKRKNENYLLMASLLIAVYILFHFPVLGQSQFRLDQTIKAEAYVFFPLMALGLLFLASFVPKKLRAIARLGLTVLFIIILSLTVAKPFYAQLKDAYAGPMRINQAEYDMAQWVEQNINYEDPLLLMGTITYGKERMIHALSRSVMRNSYFYLGVPGRYTQVLEATNKRLTNYTFGKVNSVKYAIFDYSDLQYLNNNPQFQGFFSAMDEFKQNFIDNETEPVYSTDNIFIFEINQDKVREKLETKDLQEEDDDKSNQAE